MTSITPAYHRVTRRLAALMACLLPALAAAAPITFNTALPVAQGQWLLREQYVQRYRYDNAATLGRNVHIGALGNVLAYGATSRLTLFAVTPWYLDKTLNRTTTMGHMRLTTLGLGDTQLFARYTLFQRDAVGRSFRIASLAGVIAPTGSSNTVDRFGRLPRPFQNGTGAWGGLAGVVATYQTLAWEFDADATYQATGTHDDYRAGAVSQLDGSFQYRLWPRRLGTGVPRFLYGVLETNLIHTDRDRMNGLDVADSGGTQWFVSPGLQFVTMNYVLEAAVQLPVAQHMNGHVLRDRYIFHIGFRTHFR
ncbi:transporter [Rhodanobacter denitrificans]|uniref:transporter n=1 Tax=Rhodanobacter denitrificans TaxID=666685 RepID=UPI0002E8B294|nr:transporter [Rhodanobacter denitrificans]UJM90737.1 transporter [Rhodanobacter denitrificans]